MDDLPALRLRLADLIRLRDAHAARGNASFVAYIEQVIAKTEADIELAEQLRPPARQSRDPDRTK